jgi:hypothetical protein
MMQQDKAGMARRPKIQDVLGAWEAAALERGAAVLGLALPDEPPTPIVGWGRPADDTVRMKDHLCVGCQFEKPGPDWQPIHMTRLAATMPCTRCGKILEKSR